MIISSISQTYNTELRKNEAVKRAENKPITKTHLDQYNISENAKNLSNTIQINSINEYIKVQADLRIEKIEEVKRKIEEGYYDSEEFIEKLVDKLILKLYPPQQNFYNLGI